MKLNEIHIRDPFILKANGKYYMYGTRCEAARDTWLGFDVYISTDLENWSEPISVFEKSEKFWATRQFWAPEVHKYNGKYYMFATFCAEGKCRATQILVSDAPDKAFVPLTDAPITPADWECLDGTLYVDRKGKPYIIFCHEWLQVHDGEMCVLELTSDLKNSVGRPVVLFKASEPSWADKDNNDYVTDGPFMYRTESGKLLMIWSSFAADNYIAAISYSDNGEITGNWIHQDELLFSKDGGHGMIFESYDKEKFFVLHSPNISPNERPILQKIAECSDTLKIADCKF